MTPVQKTRLKAQYDPGLEVGGKAVLCLHRNENLFVTEEWMRDFVARVARDVDTLKYPEANCLALRQALAKRYGVTSENIFVGNGSDEVLAYLLHFLRDRYDTIATLDVHFKVYDILADRFNYHQATIPGATFETEQIDATDWKGLAVVDSPNAITGLHLDYASLSRLTESPKAFLIWDNAYGEYAGDHCPNQLPENMVMVRSFSKFFGLAGARVGYCIGPSSIIAQLMRRKDVFNVNAFGQRLALRALACHSDFSKYRDAAVHCRNVLIERLRERQFHVRKSGGNFVFAEHNQLPASYIQEQLLLRDVAVRRFPGRRTDNFLRFTVSPLSGIERLMACLDEIVSVPNKQLHVCCTAKMKDDGDK